MEFNRNEFKNEKDFESILEEIGIRRNLGKIDRIDLFVAGFEVPKCYDCGNPLHECTCESEIDVYDDGSDQAYDLSKDEIY